MKLINKFKSPNFNNRKKAKSNLLLFIIQHLKNCEDAISYLCNQKNKVSSHFVISQNGEIYNLVNELKKSLACRFIILEGYTDLILFQ